MTSAEPAATEAYTRRQFKCLRSVVGPGGLFGKSPVLRSCHRADTRRIPEAAGGAAWERGHEHAFGVNVMPDAVASSRAAIAESARDAAERTPRGSRAPVAL